MALSQAQIEQRREAARSRWRKFRDGSAAVAGGLAAGVAAERATVGIIRAANSQNIRDKQPKIAAIERMKATRAARAAEVAAGQKLDAAEARVDRINQATKKARKKVRGEWPVPAFRQQMDRQINRNTARLQELHSRYKNLTHDEHQEFWDLQDANDSMASRKRKLENATPPRKVTRTSSNPVRRTAGWEAKRGKKSIKFTGKVNEPIGRRVAHTAEIQGNPNNRELDRIRSVMRARINQRSQKILDRATQTVNQAKLNLSAARAGVAQGAERGDQAAALRIKRLSQRVMTRYPSGRARVITGALGAVLGGAATYGAVSKADGLRKNAPDSGSSGGGIMEVAGNLARAFIGLRERAAGIIDRLRTDPSASDTRYQDMVRDALDPLGRPFSRAARRISSGDPEIVFSFDLIEPRVFTHFDEYRMNLVRQITDGQTETLRRTMTSMMAQGLSTDAIARRVKETVGLTAWQAQNVLNFRAELESGDPLILRRALGRQLRDKRYDRTVVKAMGTGEGIPPERVDAMVEAYQRRYIALRATTIARTEALRAANLGSVAAAREVAQEYGLDVEKTWLATSDDRTRESHRDLNGMVVVGVDMPFTLPDGRTIRWPHDPDAPADLTVACRCTLQTRLIPRQGHTTNLTATAA